MKKSRKFFEEIYNECSNIEFSLRNDSEKESQDDLERRYKIIVMTVLPILLSRVRAIFFLLSFMLGILLVLVCK